MAMRALSVVLPIVLTSALANAQGIRQIDFKNFTYPLSGPIVTNDQLKWLDPTKPGRLSLRSGRHFAKPLDFTFKSVTFVDVTGDGNDDAVVVIHLDMGNTQEADYVYIYGSDSEKPKLLAYCYTSGRGYSGLLRVYGKAGKLVFELFDPTKREYDGFSLGRVRTSYEWRNGRFAATGTRKFVVRAVPIE